jgi:hypothetical protein
MALSSRAIEKFAIWKSPSTSFRLKGLKDIIRLVGLDPSEFVGDWELHMRGVQTWLNTVDLETVKLEIYNPKTDPLIFRWDIDIAYGWSGGDGSCWTDTEQLKIRDQKGRANSERGAVSTASAQ